MPRPSPLAFARYVRNRHDSLHLILTPALVDLCLYLLEGHRLQDAVKAYNPIWSGLNAEVAERQTTAVITEIKRLSRRRDQPWIDSVNLKGPHNPLRLRRPASRSEEDFQYIVKVLRHLRKILTPPHTKRAFYRAK